MKKISLLFPAALALFASVLCVQTLQADDPPNYVFIPGEMYRMPTHFGPRTGPRRGPDGIRFENKDAPKATSLSVRFLSKRDQLQALLPEGFRVNGEPVVSVTMTYISEIPWLAGRGYNTLGVSFPVVFEGKQDKAKGNFLLVLWENLTDPILTGREELGFSKIYAELPPPRVFKDETHVTASWLGFKFMDMKLTNLQQAETPRAGGGAGSDDGVLTGLMHYKYMPRTGEWGTADAAYAVITPSGNSNARTLELWRGDGEVKFHRARWEDMPTQYTIVNGFADLEVVEFRGATLSKRVGGKDLSDQRIIR